MNHQDNMSKGHEQFIKKKTMANKHIKTFQLYINKINAS